MAKEEGAQKCGRDIVSALLEAVQRETNWPVDRLRRLEDQLRQEWGGSRYSYIRKDGAGGKSTRIAAVLATGALPEEAFERCGVPRSTGYRLIGRRWRR